MKNTNQSENTTLVADKTGNYSMVDALDNKIKNYWYSLFNNTSIGNNHTLVAAIDKQFKSYWNSVRDKFLPSYIKLTQNKT